MNRNSFLIVPLSIALVAGLYGGAAAQEATPLPETTLLDVTVGEDILPGKDAFVILGRSTAEPGAHHPAPERGEKGTIVIFVESGTLTYQIDGQGRIIRAASSDNPQEEPAPAGTSFTLSAGDALVFPAQARIEANESSEPVTYLLVIFLEQIPPPDPNPDAVGVIDGEILGIVERIFPDLPPGPATIALRRAILEPGDTQPEPSGGTQIVSQESGPAGALEQSFEGTVTIVSNGADSPIGILVLSIAPGSDAATPAATPTT
jgi:quercetin dioxygenase-like cupin family protein